MLLAYCTNVHAGSDLATTQAEWANHAVAVRRRFCPDKPLGLGAWFSARTAAELCGDRGRLEEFAGWARSQQLVPVTFNGFPYGDFHQEVVKHGVYEPPWWEEPRLEYTWHLVELIDVLFPDEMPATISTLPIGWPTDAQNREAALSGAADRLVRLADRLAVREKESGRHIMVCLEPEPGCILQRADDVVAFFEQHLLPAARRCLPAARYESVVRRHVGVCHDICHSAVMFEGQRDAIERYRAAGIAIGKVQISSAVRIPPPEASVSPKEQSAAIDQLSRFAEDRYLHQTTWRSPDGDVRFFEDLPRALAMRDQGLDREWRTHFHVPIYLASCGSLGTTQDDIRTFFQVIEPGEVLQYEVETYAWNVLPDELQRDSLAEGIAEELEWGLGVGGWGLECVGVGG